MANYFRKSNQLLRRTVGYIFLCAIFLAISSATFEFYSIYNKEIKRINDTLDQIEQTQLETLVNNAWILNNDAILIQLQSLIQHPDIIYLEFSDTHHGNKIIAGKKPVSFDGIISRTIPLHFFHSRQKTFIGTFYLLVSLEPTKAMLHQRIPLIAVTECIKIIILCGLIIWIIYYLFSRHLSRIVKFTNTLDIDKLDNRLTLQISEKRAGKIDELSQIVKAINEMQDRIQEGLSQKKMAETALRKKEELLNFATEGASLGIWDWNMVTNETYFNPTYFTMLGYEADEFAHSYATWKELIHPDDRDMATDEINQCLSQDKPWKIEFRLRTKKEGYKWILGSGKVVEKDEIGHPLRASGIHLDITESKSLDEERQKVMKLESVGVLAGGIAHDFNNILAGILGNIELASLRIKKDVKIATLLSNAQKATKRAAKLTQQLLTFSKGGDPVKETTSLSDLVRDSANFVLHGSHISCEYSFPDNLWFVNADSGQLGQVIQNITLNSIHSMPDEGELKISCRNIEQAEAKTLLNLPDENFVCISIQDSGFGIPLEIQNKIFDPYYTTKQEGSGLGLAICHSIVMKHGGHIALKSPPGQGTTFFIYLPAAVHPGIVFNKDQQAKTVIKAAKILVMDDDEMIRHVAQEQLSCLGHEAILVTNGEQAIHSFQEFQKTTTPVDVVIMDLTIPGGMGGQEAARKLLEINPEARIIVTSGYSNDPVMANYREYGFCEAISKPFDLEELRNAIESALS